MLEGAGPPAVQHNAKGTRTMKLSYKNASLALPDLCHEVLRYGADIDSRNGGTKELSMMQVELYQPWPLEITAVDRKVSIAAQIAETMWVLSGRNDVEWLSAYLPQAPKFSDDGKTWRGGYGPRLRAFGQVPEEANKGVDQLQHVINLLTRDPQTRQAVMSIYDPLIDTEPGKDIPCNNWLHLLGRDGKLNLHVATRSNDLMWGWSGINSFEWAALLHIVAGLTGYEVGSVTFSISSLHLYERHFAKAERIAQGRGKAPLFKRENPRFYPPAGMSFDSLVGRWFEIESMLRAPNVTVEESAEAIGKFPEPMLRSWLQVLAGWWYNSVPGALVGTSLGHALQVGPKCKTPLAMVSVRTTAAPAPAAQGGTVAQFVEESNKLHREKDAAYGDSWCKRGEQMSIMANIARKVDRLGKDGGGDTSLDTAQDLAIYLAKYSNWLTGDTFTAKHGAVHCMDVNVTLKAASRGTGFERELRLTVAELEDTIKKHFQGLEDSVVQDSPRQHAVALLLNMALALAYKLWSAAGDTEAAQTEQEFLGNTPAKVTDVDAWRAGNATRQFNGYDVPEES